MTITGVISPTGASGNYSWTISPSAGIEVIGDNLQGTKGAGDPVTKTSICIHGISTGTLVNIIFTFTPTNGIPITSTPYTATEIAVTVIIDPNNPPKWEVNIGPDPIWTKSYAGDVKPPIITFTISASISTTPSGMNNCAQDFDLTFTQDLITETITYTYITTSIPISTVSFNTRYPAVWTNPQGQPVTFPLWDVADPLKPWPKSVSFTGDGSLRTGIASDQGTYPVPGNPDPYMRNASGCPSWAATAVIAKFQYDATYVRWAICRNRVTGDIVWWYWWVWEIHTDVNYDANGKPIEQYDANGNLIGDTATVTNQGTGPCPVPGAAAPVIGGTTAGQYVNINPPPGGYGVK